MAKTRFAVFLLALAIPLRAQEASRFLIERIEIRNLVHASAEVVRTELRLNEAAAYSETELRDANRRIKRLPFVLDAAFSLEKGSVRDAYVLVVTVTETRPLFFVWDSVIYKTGRTIASDYERGAVLGARMFVGRDGVVHVAILEHKGERPYDLSYSSFQTGYTRYGILGTQSFATITVNANEGNAQGDGYGGGKVSPGALIGVALSPNQTLTVSYSAVDLGTTHRSSERIFESRVSYDTTNHPFFPTEGTLLSAAPVVTRTDIVSNGDLIHAFDAGIDGHAARYWPLNERDGLALIAEGGVVHVERRVQDVSSTFYDHYGSMMAKVSRQIGTPNRETEQRLELTLRAISNPRTYAPLLRNKTKTLSLAWLRRNSWGLLRLGVGYAR